jgi:glycogen debranching enzyme
MLSNFGYRVPTYSGRSLDEMTSNELESIVTRLSLPDLNRVLYRCDAEERDDHKGFGAYVVPGYGPLVYCGLQGLLLLVNSLDFLFEFLWNVVVSLSVFLCIGGSSL